MKRYVINAEDCIRFNTIEAKDLEEAEKKVLDMIDIQEEASEPNEVFN